MSFTVQLVVSIAGVLCVAVVWYRVGLRIGRARARDAILSRLERESDERQAALDDLIREYNRGGKRAETWN